MTDYFHTAYYINAELGSWDKAWKLKTWGWGEYDIPSTFTLSRVRVNG
jgi:hypothetical protein